MKSWQGVIEPQNKRFLMDDSSPAVLPRRDVSFGSKTIVLIFAKKACSELCSMSDHCHATPRRAAAAAVLAKLAVMDDLSQPSIMEIRARRPG